MNKIVVLYDSRSGNTKKMAKLVCDGALSLSETDVRFLSVSEASAQRIYYGATGLQQDLQHISDLFPQI